MRCSISSAALDLAALLVRAETGRIRNHDLRTPITAISGHVQALLFRGPQTLPAPQQLLNALVENALLFADRPIAARISRQIRPRRIRSGVLWKRK